MAATGTKVPTSVTTTTSTVAGDSPGEGGPPSEGDRWVVIYPIYINAKKSRSEGRRISTQGAVETPTLNEVVAALKKLGLQYKEEADKKYPRDFNQRGRVRVCLKDAKGNPANANIKKRKQLLESVAKSISQGTRGKGGNNPTTGKKKNKR